MTTTTITQVPLLDLNRQYEPIMDEVLTAVSDVFESKQFILGPKVNELETAIAKYCQCPHAVGVASGTDALLIAIMALDIGPGDEVITTPFTFFATAGCISRVGATPVFVDIDPKTYNINPNLIEEKITDKTKAIIPVHLYGQMADMDSIMSIAKKHNLYVIEDAAQAIGAEYKGQRAGSIGDIGSFSFYPSKNLGCAGDGGIVTTKKPKLADKMKCLRVHGSKPKYYHHLIGGNFRLDSIKAAVLSVKLRYLDAEHAKRQENAQYYLSELKSHITPPYIAPENTMIYNQFTIRSSRRDELMKRLKDHEIGCVIYYPVSLHLQPCFENLNYQEGDLPESEKAAKEVLSIPIYSELTREEMDYVISVLNDCV